jgi:hypothetical protein
MMQNLSTNQTASTLKQHLQNHETLSQEIVNKTSKIYLQNSLQTSTFQSSQQ